MKSASVIVLKNKNRVLMHLRDDKPGIAYPGYWSFIGGGIEREETPLQSIERECLEEIGIKPRNIRLIKKIFLPFDDSKTEKYYEVFIFSGELDQEADEIKLTEGQKIQYFCFDDIENLRISLGLKKFILENKSLFLSGFNPTVKFGV
jgi:8-oxo-dGTP diphosphatase